MRRNISGFPPEKLAGLGLVRTFQNIELFGKMTVLENVMVGLHTRSRSGIFSCAFRMPWQMSEERVIRERAKQWLEFAGISEDSGAEAASLSFGKGRLLEIARAMALEPRIILMDEPAAGLNSRETCSLPISSGRSGTRVSPWCWSSMTWNWSWTSATRSSC